MRNTLMGSVLLLALAASSGCGTMQCCQADDQEVWPIYGGIAYDWKAIETSLNAGPDTSNGDQRDKATPPTPKNVALTALDLPLCAVADTLLLPITVTYAFARWCDEWDQKR